MIIFFRKRTIIITIVFIMCLAIIFHYTRSSKSYVPTFRQVTEEDLKEKLFDDIAHIFDLRNEALLKEKVFVFDSLYNKHARNGLWAYEHEIKKMNYIHLWSRKQGANFMDINSDIVIRRATEKGDGYTLNLLVSTEYTYKYINESDKSNSFRLGTHHTLDIIPGEQGWIISKEWYADPLFNTISLDEETINNISSKILSGEMKDLSDLEESRINAVAYADEFCGAASLPEYGFKYNSKYTNFNYQGGDCANFASQILYEAGNFKKNGTWNYEKGAGSRAWLNAHAFNQYMTNSGRGSVITRGSYKEVLSASYKLLPGDYIAYEEKGKVSHISVVTGIDSKGYALVNSHNADRYRVPWDIGWSGKNVKFWLVRVHY
ncbi:amidase domain-containing protein [Serpentinicella sp. ANB-PHB4]|uniref:amidase domain-containing protein n=1 Tax=Serpentinicella sp. ANB-PHB4 TaxID=3074076 RepID=UPI00285581BF|nr:amidase domain-containing protein [Serpentinicella sp. ANB-PHB4]MDR5658511.1 amidase domain-containing protein [Serpentinicella sp. ANB-PHB4]